MRVSNRKVGNTVNDSLKSILLETEGAAGSLYFMDALRLARMLEKAALDDVQSKAKAMGASEESVEKLKKDISYLAKVNPIEGYRISRACNKASKYLSDNINKSDVKLSKAKLPTLKPLYNREKYMQRFDAGFDNDEMINSNVPNLFMGSRESLNIVINHLLDRCEINESCCLHLSMKSFNKKLNKNYKRIKPEDWEGKLKAKGGLKELLIEGSKLKPLEVLLVDELSNGYSFSDKQYTSLKKAHMCFNNASLSTCARGIVLLAFQEVDNDLKVKESEAMSAMLAKSNYFECFSDDNGTYVKDRMSNIVLTIRKS